MTVRLSEAGVIELSGHCPLEDADRLQQYLIARPAAPVDWRACSGVHAAVLQILLAVHPAMLGPPESVYLRSYFTGSTMGSAQ
jgi:hypothetical protein